MYSSRYLRLIAPRLQINGGTQAWYCQETAGKGSSAGSKVGAPLHTHKSHAPQGRIGLTDHRINNFERFLLVWAGKYKTMAEVPALIGQDTLERARNKARIKINLMMVAATLLGCGAMIYSGKKARSEGQSVVKMNEDFHRKYNEEQIAKAKAAAAAKGA